jgi:aminopeptidase N
LASKALGGEPNVRRLTRLCASLLVAVHVSAAGPSPTADIDVLHYALTITPDFDTRSVSGETHISFRSQRDALADIRFSGNSLTVDRATIQGQPARASRDHGDVVVALPQPLARGQTATMTIAFHGVPARGLAFGQRSVYTSYFTCDWMFCVQDRPGDKATIDLTVVVPRGMTSVGVGARGSVAPAAGGFDAHGSRETRPYSSYVYGFAAGEFHVVSERHAGAELVYLSETAPPERLRALFAGTGAMVDFFEEKAGVPLPHGRYVQVHVPGAAAQEADAFSVIGDDMVSPILENPQEDWVIAHELAHQWWGNLVTCADWNEFWLNEGITTFMVAAWKEHRWGRASYDREMELARQRVEAASKAGTVVPLTFPGPFPTLSARRATQYSKGALFMDRLRRELGEQRFWDGLRSFTRTYRGTTVVSRDFQRVFERASGRDLGALFNEWVY